METSHADVLFSGAENRLIQDIEHTVHSRVSSRRVRYSRVKRPIQVTQPSYLCCDLTSLVAFSTQTMRHPVTLGSSVPEWPVFSTRRIRLIQATTSWDDGFDGLSKLMKPGVGEESLVATSKKTSYLDSHSIEKPFVKCQFQSHRPSFTSSDVVLNGALERRTPMR